MKHKLKQLVEQIILEELSIDEPEGDVFGKVLFGTQRTDNVEKEPNTAEESEVLLSLIKHIEKNDSSDLEGDFDILYSLTQKDKYSKLLKPEEGNVYRVLFGLTERQMKSIFGLKEEDLDRYREVQTINTSKKLIPRHKSIQSWTANLNIDSIHELHGIYEGSELTPETPYFVIVSANVPSSGKFILNPEFSSKIKSLKNFEHEAEVISKGPVKLNKIAFVNMAHPPNKPVFEESDIETIKNYVRQIQNKSNEGRKHFLESDLWGYIQNVMKKINISWVPMKKIDILKQQAKAGKFKEMSSVTYEDLSNNSSMSTADDENEELILKTVSAIKSS